MVFKKNFCCVPELLRQVLAALHEKIQRTESPKKDLRMREIQRLLDFDKVNGKLDNIIAGKESPDDASRHWEWIRRKIGNLKGK